MVHKARWWVAFISRLATHCSRHLSSAACTIAAGLIVLLRPLLGPIGVCRYHISCTVFAQRVLAKKQIIPAIILIARRMSTCHPFSS